MSILTCCGCGSAVSHYRTVDIQDYVNLEKCWTKGRSQVALLIVDHFNSKSYPYLISPFCAVKLSGYGREDSVMAVSKSLPIVDRQRSLRSSGATEFELQSNAIDHLPFPRKSQQLSLVNLELIKKSNDFSAYYSIGKVLRSCKLGINLDRYQKMSDYDREKVAKAGCDGRN